MKILVTCPPMLGMIKEFDPIFKNYNLDVTAPEVIQTLSVAELLRIVPEHHGWIIGDDPATREVFEAGKKGNLTAAVKWGIGVDNVDFQACKDLNIPIENTPNMFGGEVADIAVGYVIGLARETFFIHEEVKRGEWPKPRGISLSGKTAAIIGLGDIGLSVANRLLSMDMKVIGYDPSVKISDDFEGNINNIVWPNKIETADYLIITCALNNSSYHMVNEQIFTKVKKGLRVVNVGRGPIINEKDLENALKSEKVYSAAMDVFEVEPLPINSYLRTHPRCIFGSHNASNTIDAVIRTSKLAIDKINNFLKK